MKLKNQLLRIIAACALFAAAFFAPEAPIPFRQGLFILSYITAGYDVVLLAVRNIFRGKVFDENFLMTIATFGAFALRDFDEACAVMLFYQVGELFQKYAIDQSRRSISSLMDIRPDYANLKTEEGITQVDPEEVAVGDIIVIKPGERVPLDSIVIDGFSALDMSALTGESIPKDVASGDALLSGCINTSGLLTARVSKIFEESTVSKILDLVENASSKKSKSENFISKFARYYTPAVVIVAALLALVPPLVVSGATFSEWVPRALIFLVISCPCALVISIPLSFFGGIGGAAKQGILVKGSNYLEALAETGTVVFDKTGTLTKGIFDVTEVFPAPPFDRDGLIYYAAHAECYSSHPIALSLRRAYGKPIDENIIDNVTEIAGKGLSAGVSGKTIHAGSLRLMEDIGTASVTPDSTGTLVYVAIDGVFAGCIAISDTVKADSAAAISSLKAMGIEKTVMLTGDNQQTAERIGKQLGIDRICAQLLPGDKVDIVEELLSAQSEKSKLAFVGDGINDAPVLARADIGIAMGALGSDAAIEAADIVIMTDEPSKLATAIKISKKTLSIAKQNTVFAIGVKLIVMALGAAGKANMWAAVFADVGVAVLAILNSLRALSTKDL